MPTLIQSELRALTDTGNAERLIDRYGKELRFCEDWQKWLVWQGTHWALDLGAEVAHRVKETIRLDAQLMRSRYRELNREKHETTDDTERGRLDTKLRLLKLVGPWLVKSESAARRHATEILARSEPRVPVRAASLNVNPYLFNLKNGTYDLEAGRLKKHDPSDLITTVADVAFDPNAQCLLWRETLARVIPDPTVRAFFQRAVGYSMVGAVLEEAFFFLYGLGANGKSTALETLLALFGPYGAPLPIDAIILKNQTAHPTELASLHGKRLAVTSEAPAGKQFDESRLKDLTSRTPIKVRRMREDEWDLIPSHTLWMAGNHRPRIYGQDTGIWRRVNLIPFDVQIPIAERDRDLPKKLNAELPGILNWAIDGFRAWRAGGLQRPSIVIAASEEYRESQDDIAEFVQSSVFVSPGVRCRWTDFVRSYRKFCDEQGDKSLSKKALKELVTTKGWRIEKGESYSVLVGATMRSPEQPRHEVQESF